LPAQMINHVQSSIARGRQKGRESRSPDQERRFSYCYSSFLPSPVSCSAHEQVPPGVQNLLVAPLRPLSRASKPNRASGGCNAASSFGTSPGRERIANFRPPSWNRSGPSGQCSGSHGASGSALVAPAGFRSLTGSPGLGIAHRGQGKCLKCQGRRTWPRVWLQPWAKADRVPDPFSLVQAT
jgi:hypothetical protein